MKMLFRRLLLFSATALCMLQAQAQEKNTVTGTVKDNAGTPLASVTVKEKGTARSTMTDMQGAFKITVGSKAVLQFSSVGYESYETSVNGANTLDIVLNASSKEMNEVVVTALGVKREKRSLGYAAQTVAGKDLTVAMAPTIAQGLYGKVAGLNISQASGGVEGGSSRLVIRGNTSITGDNRALIIVDGVAINNDPMNSNANNNNGGGTGTKLGADVASYKDWGTGLNFINPEDIESVSVLKGPAAAALYGARGANGVVLITRKKGTKRKGLGVDYSYSSRATQVYEYLDFQNEYGNGLLGSLWTADQGKQFPVNGAGKRYQIGTYSGSWGAGDYKTGAFGDLPYNVNGDQSYNQFSWPSGLSWGPRFDNQPVLWYDGVQRPYSAQPDNWKAFFPNGSTTQHTVSMSGGGDFGSARFSYTRNENKANTLNSNYKTNTFTLGSTLKVSSRLSADITGSYINYNRLNTPPIGTSGDFMAGFAYAATRDFRSDVELANNFGPGGAQRDVTQTANFPAGSPNYPYAYVGNSFWNTYKNNTTLGRNQLIGGIKLTADITNWLTVIGNAAIDNSTDDIETKNYPRDVQGTQGSYQHSLARSTNRNLNVLARIHKDNLANKEINAALSAGAESYFRNDYSTSARTNGNFLRPFIFATHNGVNPENYDGGNYIPEIRYAKKINSAFGFLDLSYKNYLFLQVTGRNDWSSTLPDPYFYPSANLAYVFTDGIAGIKKSAPWLSFGKMTFSYAETGSDTDPYAIHNLISTSPYNGQVAQTYPSNLKFPGIKPQRSKQYELTANLGFLNNRLNVELSAYSMKTFNQILSNPLPISSGYSSIQINKGSLGNKGIEFVINATPVSNKNFSWNVAVNGAHSQTKVLALDEGIEALQLGSFFGGAGVTQRVKVGDNYGTIYGRDFTYKNGQRVVERAKGANKQEMGYTVNGKTYAAGTNWVLTPDEVAIGNSTPFLTGGISNTLRYGNLSLYALVDGKFGGDTYFGTYAAAMGNGLLQGTVKERNGGGLPMVYPDGTTSNTGISFGGVFADGTPNTDVVAAPWYYIKTYTSWNNIGVPRSASVFENTWMKLREVNLTYQVPARFVQKTKVLQNLSLSLIGRDLFYIFTTIPKGLNPEGVNGIGNMQGIEYSSMPRIRSFGFSIKTSL